MDIGNQIRELIKSSSEIKKFIGGLPFSSEINREISNYEKFIAGLISERQRIRIGFYELNKEKNLIAYQSLTLLNNATPTAYEKKQIGLKEKLNYVQGKLIVVNPYYWRKGIGTKLIYKTLNISNNLSMDFVADVKKENKAIVNLLEKQNINRFFEWKTPNGTKMWRMQKRC